MVFLVGSGVGAVGLKTTPSQSPPGQARASRFPALPTTQRSPTRPPTQWAMPGRESVPEGRTPARAIWWGNLPCGPCRNLGKVRPATTRGHVPVGLGRRCRSKNAPFPKSAGTGTRLNGPFPAHGIPLANTHPANWPMPGCGFVPEGRTTAQARYGRGARPRGPCRNLGAAWPATTRGHVPVGLGRRCRPKKRPLPKARRDRHAPQRFPPCRQRNARLHGIQPSGRCRGASPSLSCPTPA